MAAAKKVLKSLYDTMPKTIRVGNLTYKVYAQRSVQMDMMQCMGVCLLDKSEIWVSPDLHDQMLAETLLHEVIHAIHANFDLTDDCNEERYTLLTARGIAQLWYDNPKLIEWFGGVFSK